MTQTKHTATSTPRFRLNNEGVSIVTEVNGKEGGGQFKLNNQGISIVEVDGKEYSRRFIVRAVNSHEALVEACKDALVMLCDLADEVNQDNYGLLDRFREAKNTVEEALKQAEEV